MIKPDSYDLNSSSFLRSFGEIEIFDIVVQMIFRQEKTLIIFHNQRLDEHKELFFPLRENFALNKRQLLCKLSHAIRSRFQTRIFSLFSYLYQVAINSSQSETKDSIQSKTGQIRQISKMRKRKSGWSYVNKSLSMSR